MTTETQRRISTVAQTAITAIRRGDDTSAEDWLELVRRELTRLAADILRNRDEAEDMAQAALLNFVNYIRDVPVEIGNPMGLAATIVRNLCIGSIRRRSRRRHLVSLSSLVLDDGSPVELASEAIPPDQWFEQEEKERLLEEAVRGLKPKYQRVLRGLYWDGKTKKTVAHGLRISVRTVHNIRERALALLTERIRRICVSSSSAGSVRYGEGGVRQNSGHRRIDQGGRDE